MKRDMDLIRDILLHHEKHSDDNFYHTLNADNFENFDAEKLYSHVRLLMESGHIGYVDQTMGGEDIDLGGISPAGYDFLDSVRDPEVWRNTKELVNKAGGWSLEMMGDLARGLIKTQLKKLTGVEI
jgi:hypothetical protein